MHSATHSKLLAVPTGIPSFRTLAGIGLPLITVLAWGGQFPVAKTALPSLNAFYLSADRYVLASLVFLAILWWAEGREALRFDGQFRRVFLLGSIGFAGFNLLAFVGLTHTRPQNAALLVAAMPALTAIVVWIQRGTRPSKATVAFLAAALVGVALVVTRGSLSLITSGQVGIWDLMVLLGVTCWVIYTLGASSIPGWSPLRFTALSATTGAVSIVLITLAATGIGVITAPSPGSTVAVTVQIAYMVIPATVIAVLAWNAGIKLIGPQNAVLFINLVPVITLSIQVARGNSVSGIELVGVGVTILALVGNNLWQRRASAPQSGIVRGDAQAA